MCRTFQIPREFKELTVLENVMVVAKEQLGERLWAPWLVPGRVRRQEAEIRAKSVEERMADVIAIARSERIPTWRAADRLAERRLEMARSLRMI
jgi:branched-chain amino acid transport system ATP-binding protein